MSAQPIGHADMLIAKREAMVARLSPEARHARFPQVYARPLPTPDLVVELKSKNDALTVENSRLSVENEELRCEIKALTEKWGSHSQVARVRIRPLQTSEVIKAYLAALDRHGYRIEGASYTMEHLLSHRRASTYAQARHVAMYLCRSLCIASSLTMIGRQFNRDHTSIMHGCMRAVKALAEDSLLAAVANDVQALFEAQA